MLWVAFGFMLLVAALVVAWPLYREEHRLSVRSALAIVAVITVSAALYSQIGQPDARTAITGNNSVEEMVQALASRLEADPDDLSGWKMLARSYGQFKRYPQAIAAYERAVELEQYSDAQTLADLGEAIMLNDNNALRGRASELFENALAITPRNPKALFYGGLAAIERGDPLLAADRWETLLASSPPVEIEGILRQRIAEWRGTEVAAPAPPGEAVDGVEITVDITLGEAARQAVDPGATVFIIARDPAQPAPPIAVIRKLASELPFTAVLSDADSMLPGRALSQFTTLEIIVRASMSGQPIAQPGDWFGSRIIDAGTTRDLGIVIGQQVP